LQLEIQKYLRSGKTLDDLKAETGIEYNQYGQLVILNYSQIDSPKVHPIVFECRGIVLEKDTWDIVSYPFRRFFNYGEVFQVTDSFDFTRATGIEKLDGSLISVFNYKDAWFMASRAVIENNCKFPFSNLTMKDLFYSITKKYPKWKNLDKAYNYCFELTAPENKVVTVYNTQELHLLTMREVGTWKELSIDQVKQQSDKIGVNIPNVVLFKDKDSLIELAKSLATLQEGFVAVDYSTFDEDGISFKRVKVKNPSYVAIQHLKDRAGRSLRSLTSLIIDGNVDEFLGYFPEFKPMIEQVQVSYNEYVLKMENDKIRLMQYFDQERTQENRKLFAIKAGKCINPSFMFALYDYKVKSVFDFFMSLEKNKTRAFLEKYLVEKLKLKDMELYKEI